MREAVVDRIVGSVRSPASPGPYRVETQLVLGALATWRMAHLLTDEDGPADLVVRLRSRLGDGRLGALMDCFKCVSVWVAGPVALMVVGARRSALLVWPALSGAACLLQAMTGHDAHGAATIHHDRGGD